MPYESLNMEALLAALYLPGAPRSHEVRRDRWPGVAGVLQAAGAEMGEARQVLRESGYWSEALALETPGLLGFAERLAMEGMILTAASPGYPARWLEVLSAPPPALWKQGEVPTGPCLSVVGSRHISAKVRVFAAEVGVEANRAGLVVVSGGAVGCDQAAVSRASHVVEIMPHGYLGGRARHCRLSARPPGEPFTVAGAMERNALIYAASSHTVVAHARFKQGGAWTGATDALRRRLSHLLVGIHSEEHALRALVALGAVQIRDPKELAEAMSSGGRQESLFAW